MVQSARSSKHRPVIVIERSSIAAEIEQFLAETGVLPTVFGRDAMGDPRFVFDLRNGRELRTATANRALVQMALYRQWQHFVGPEHVAALQQQGGGGNEGRGRRLQE